MFHKIEYFFIVGFAFYYWTYMKYCKQYLLYYVCTLNSVHLNTVSLWKNEFLLNTVAWSSGVQKSLQLQMTVLSFCKGTLFWAYPSRLRQSRVRYFTVRLYVQFDILELNCRDLVQSDEVFQSCLQATPVTTI